MLNITANFENMSDGTQPSLKRLRTNMGTTEQSESFLAASALKKSNLVAERPSQESQDITTVNFDFQSIKNKHAEKKELFVVLLDNVREGAVLFVRPESVNLHPVPGLNSYSYPLMQGEKLVVNRVVNEQTGQRQMSIGTLRFITVTNLERKLGAACLKAEINALMAASLNTIGEPVPINERVPVPLNVEATPAPVAPVVSPPNVQVAVQQFPGIYLQTNAVIEVPSSLGEELVPPANLVSSILPSTASQGNSSRTNFQTLVQFTSSVVKEEGNLAGSNSTNHNTSSSNNNGVRPGVNPFTFPYEKNGPGKTSLMKGRQVYIPSNKLCEFDQYPDGKTLISALLVELLDLDGEGAEGLRATIRFKRTQAITIITSRMFLETLKEFVKMKVDQTKIPNISERDVTWNVNNCINRYSRIKIELE